MHRAIKAGLLAVLLTVAVAVPVGAIVYGEPDNGAHPNVGSLLFDFDANGVLDENDQLCTGTLISPTVLVTASHCTVFYGDEPAYVTFDQDLTGTLTIYQGVADVNPEFFNKGKAHFSDVGVVVFDTPITSIAPAALPAAGVLDQLKASGTLNSTRFTTVGYGAVREQKQKSFANLFPSTERRVATQSFRSLNAHWLNLSMNVSTGSGGTCYGDSGGRISSVLALRRPR